MRYVRPIFTVNNVLFLTVVLILSSCLTMRVEADKTPSYTNRMQILSLKDNYNDALAIAQKWQSDAYLQSADATVKQENQTRPLILSYTFLSKKKRSEALLAWIDEDKTIQIETIDISASMEDRREIKPEGWLLDGKDALQIAQEHGGSDYIDAYGLVDIDIFLEFQKRLPNNNAVIWRVSYLRPDGEGNIYILVNAMNGDVVSYIE